MNVDIYIREKNGSREIRVPWLPERIQYETGEATVATYDIMDKGEVAIPTGTGLASVSWESEFPGAKRTDKSMLRGTWQDPKTYDSILKSWKENKTVLNLLVTGYPINLDVILIDYTGEATGGFGDISYVVKFTQKREIVITSEKVEVQKPATTTTQTTRPASKDTSYTIKKGDTLWAIAKKFYGAGSKWTTIYNANKSIIESTAKKHGKKSSDNGHWIYPGTKITIPGATASSSSGSSSGSGGSGSSSSKSSSSTKKVTLTVKNNGVKAYFGKFDVYINGKKVRSGSASNYSVTTTSGATIKITPTRKAGGSFKITASNFKITANRTITITWKKL